MGANFEFPRDHRLAQALSKASDADHGPGEQVRDCRSRACDHAWNVAVVACRRASATIPTAVRPSIRSLPRRSGRTRPCRRWKSVPRERGRRRLLRSQLRLQLRQDHRLQHPLDPAAHGAQSAQGVPADVRPGRHRKGALLAADRERQHHRTWCAATPRICRARSCPRQGDAVDYLDQVQENRAPSGEDGTPGHGGSCRSRMRRRGFLRRSTNTCI